MTPFAWLLGFLLPACGAEGAAGLPTPVWMDLTRIERPATPNTFLAGPVPSDLVPPVWHQPADVFYRAARAVLAAQPRTFIAAEFPDRRQIHFVVRSSLMNYPDLVTVEVDPAGPGQSTLVIWSRSVYGHSDLGANRKRVEAWIAALPQPNER